MSKALSEVMQYANEDVASIRKHWIVFVKMVWRIFIFSVIVAVLRFKVTWILNIIGDLINNLLTFLPFMIKDNLTLISILAILIYSIKQILTTYGEYTTVGLTINNIQIKGKSGLVDIGFVNSSLDQVRYVKTDSSLFGRLLNYGQIEISIHNATFTMYNMTEVAKFQEAIIMMQEAQKEGRNIRSEERNAVYNREIMLTQAKLDNESRMNQAKAQAQAFAAIVQNSNNTSENALPQTTTGMIEDNLIDESESDEKEGDDTAEQIE